MSLLVIAVIIFLGTILGKFLFKHWLNHLSLYCIVFGGSLFLYELKLLPYIDLTPYAWLLMLYAFLSFLIGILTIVSARNLYRKNPISVERSDIALKIFADNGTTLKITIFIFSIISLYSAIELWMIFINKFGSIPAVLLNGEVIYRMNVSGKIKGNTPYLHLLGFAAIFLSGIYTAYKKKFTLLTFFPLVSIILREIAGAGRAGMLFALMQFILSFLLFKHLLSTDLNQRFKFSKASAIVGAAILLLLFIGGSTLVKATRVSDVGSSTYSAASKELRQTRGNLIISPSLYLYLSSDVGVFCKYLSSEGERTPFGQNTFMTAYNFLGKMNIVQKPHEFQKGYYIPMWTNTGTYLRELHADFGPVGVFLGPYLLGLLITWLWFKFLEKKSLITFVFLVNLNLIVGFSFFVMATRVLYWFTSLVLIIVLIPVLERVAQLVKNQRNAS
jgi:oligosaccharide repeat unit polymerase